MDNIATSLISDDEREYMILKNRAYIGADDGTYEWALNEIERLREALLQIAGKVSQTDKSFDGDMASDIARTALGEGKE